MHGTVPACDIRMTAIVTTYNRRVFLEEALQSLFTQSVPLDQIVVVDDGSTDSTLELLASYGDRVTVVRQKNVGSQAARNAGIAHSRHDWIAFCDDDDLWTPDRCEIVKALLRRQAVDIVATDISIFSREGIVLPSVFERHRKVYPAIWSHIKRQDDEPFSFASNIPPTDLLPEYPFWGATLVVSRQTLDALGGWNPAVRGIPSEDLEFVFRALRNRRIGVIWKPTILYRSHMNNVSNDPKRKYLGRVDIVRHLVADEADPEQRKKLDEFVRTALDELLWSYAKAGDVRSTVEICKRIGWRALRLKQAARLTGALLRRSARPQRRAQRKPLRQR